MNLKTPWLRTSTDNVIVSYMMVRLSYIGIIIIQMLPKSLLSIVRKIVKCFENSTKVL